MTTPITTPQPSRREARREATLAVATTLRQLADREVGAAAKVARAFKELLAVDPDATVHATYQMDASRAASIDRVLVEYPVGSQRKMAGSLPAVTIGAWDQLGLALGRASYTFAGKECPDVLRMMANDYEALAASDALAPGFS